MPKRVAKEAKRVPLNCLVLPETLAWLRTSGVSQGVAVDRVVARAMLHQTEGWVAVPPETVERANKVMQQARPLKGAILKSKDKKK